MNTMHFFFGLGAFFSPIVAAQVMVHRGGIRWAYWLLALVGLPLALWLARLPSPPNPQRQTLAGEGRTEKVNYKLVLLLTLVLFLYVGAEVGFGGWIYTVVLTLGLTDETQAAYLTAAFWGSFTVGRLLGIPLSTRFRPSRILASDLIGGVASLAIILLWPNSVRAVLLGTVGLGLSLASVFPTVMSFGERRMTLTGQVTGWLFVGSGGGAMFLPWLLGQIFDRGGPLAAVGVLLFDLVVAAGIFVFLMAFSRRRRALQRVKA